MVATNLVTNHGAVADGKWYYGAWAIAAGGDVLTAPAGADDFVSGDVGKSIMVGAALAFAPQGGQPLLTTIAEYLGPTQVRLSAVAPYGLPNAEYTNSIVSWGTNNVFAFDNFNTAYEGATDVVLTIPAGTYHLADGNYLGLFKWVKGITVEGAGATIAGGTFGIGAAGQYGATGNYHARTATVLAGATHVMCLTPSEISRFSSRVGEYALMTGISLQYGGYPTNHYFFDWVLISAVDSNPASPTYGKISFTTTPLAHTYKSTWPEIIPFVSNQIYYGGPATLYAWWNDDLGVYGYPGNFDHTLVVNNLTIAHQAQFAIRGRNITLNNCVFMGDYGPYPTMCHTVNMNNCTCLTGHMEVDKYTLNFTMTGGTWGGIGIQSSNENVTLNGVEVVFSVNGTAKHMVIRNGCRIGTGHPDAGLVLGAQYGASRSVSVSDSELFRFDSRCEGIVIPGASPSNNGVNNDYDMEGGVITVAKSLLSGGYSTMWMVPNAHLSWYDLGRGWIGRWRILDITDDVDNVYVTTDWPGTFPAGPYYNGKLWIGRHGAPIATFSNVTGCAEVEDLSANHVAGNPVNTRTKREYDGSIVTSEYVTLEGQLLEMDINVLEAYSGGSGGPITTTLGPLNSCVKISDQTLINVDATIDLKVAGRRRWTLAGGWTSTAVGASDTLPTISVPVRVTNSVRMTMADISGEPEGNWPRFTFDVITDQALTFEGAETQIIAFYVTSSMISRLGRR